MLLRNLTPMEWVIGVMIMAILVAIVLAADL